MVKVSIITHHTSRITWYRMTRVILIFVLCFLSYGADACPNLIGTWQSSKVLSMNFNLKHANLNLNQIDFLSQTLGILKQTYSELEIHNHGAPFIKLVLNGKSFDFHFEDLHYKYEVVSCTSIAVKLKQYYPYGDPINTQIVFESKNTFWISPEQLPKSREYFVRVLN